MLPSRRIYGEPVRIIGQLARLGHLDAEKAHRLLQHHTAVAIRAAARVSASGPVMPVEMRRIRLHHTTVRTPPHQLGLAASTADCASGSYPRRSTASWRGF